MTTTTHGLWNPTDVFKRRQTPDGWPGADEDASGLVLIRPTSISYTSGYAFIDQSGSVTSYGAGNLTINGVFTSQYTNYMYVVNNRDMSLNPNFHHRLCVNGVATTTDYNYRYKQYSNTSYSWTSTTSSSIHYGPRGYNRGSYPGMVGVGFIYGPQLPQQTNHMAEAGYQYNIVYRLDPNGTQISNTQFDGISFYTATGVGTFSIYGWEQ